MRDHLPKVLIACLGAFIGAVGYWFATADTPQEPDPTPPAITNVPTPPETTRASSAGVKVVTEPADAQVYINWMHRGTTPAEFQSNELSGQIALIKEGYEPRFYDVKTPLDRDIRHTFQAEKTRPNNRMVLLMQPASARYFHHIKSSLRRLALASSSQDKSLQLQMNGTAGMSNPAVRASVRQRYDVDFILYGDVQENIEEFAQEIPFTDNEKIAVFRATVTVLMDVYNLRTGNQIAGAKATAQSDLTPDPRIAVEWAVRHAADECAAETIQRLAL